jgi:Heterokaryon incompatibility protein (HET)
MPGYRYTPLQSLNHIRVLHLEPGSGSEPIVYRLSSVSLLENPVYEALSYTWGDPSEPRESIICNGTSTPVMKNLKAAFLRLRLRNEIRTVWVDAICIDQNNIPERNAQVQLMSQIYRKATMVVVWLGEETAESAQEMEMLEKLAAARELRVKQYPSDAYNRITPEQLQEYGLPPLDAHSWQDIKRLYFLPWFGRMWVQQEIAMAGAAIVIYGGYINEWNLYAMAAQFLEMTQIGHQIGSGGHGSAARIDSFHRTLRQGAADIDSDAKEILKYFTILQGSRNSLCTDPRDMVYGFLGIINEPGEKFTDIDYASPVPNVYMKFTLFLINKEKSLRILGTRLDISVQSLKGLPSWCTDWTASCFVRQLTLQKAVPYKAAGNTEASVRLIDNNILAVKGSIVDQIVDVGSPFHGFGVRAAEVRIPQDWDAIAANCKGYPTGEPIHDAWWKTLLAGQVTGESERRFRFFFFCWYNRFCKGGRNNPVPLDVDEDEVTSAAHYFAQTAAASSRETTFFSTQRGFIGTGHPSVEPGDIVVVLHGGPTPYILRPTIEADRFKGWYVPSSPLITFRNEVYLFIGECYVHGIMQGEAIGKGAVLVEEFRIC